MSADAMTMIDAEQADASALDAAARSGVEIEPMHEPAELKDFVALLVRIWESDEKKAPVTPELLRALGHAGNYVVGARLDGALVGASMGFFGEPSLRILHSHISGVAPETQGRSVGFALKQHQRAWAMERGIGTITWTFDPLVRRNAWFNIAKLGARVVGYLPDFYGTMTDGINGGDESDRCYTSWDLTSPRTRAAARREWTEPDLDALRAGGAAALVTVDADGAPTVTDAKDAVTLLCQVPADSTALRAADPALAGRWRVAVRECLGGAIAEGYEVTAMTRTGWYVLTRENTS